MMKWLKMALELLWLAVPRWLKARDRKAEAQAEEAIVRGDATRVNADFKDLLRAWPLALVCGAPLLLFGCASKPRLVVVPADEAMVPLVRDAVEVGCYRIPAQGVPCEGWYVPNATLLKIRRKLEERK